MRIFGAFISSLCLAATLLTGSAAAQGDAGIHFFAEPAPGSNSSLGYFVIDAEPGDSIKQAIALRNDSKKQMTLRLYGADATTSIYGGADYTSVDTETTGVGSWIALQDDEVTLKPKEGAVIRFRVRVPTDAPTGENLGGIAIYPVVEPSTDEESEAASNQAGAQVVVEYRRVVAVQVNTPGKTEPNLVISGIKPTARPDGAYLDMNIANEGTALTKGTGVIRVPGFDFEREFDLDTFVPGSKIFYPLRFDDSIPVGEHDATIRIEYDEGDKVVEWNSTFAVGEELQAELAERGAPGAVPTTTRGNLVPLALALALGFMMLTFFRRTRRQVVPAGQAPGPMMAGSAAPRANETETPTAPARYVAPSKPSTDRPKAAPKKPARRRTPASSKATGTKSTAARKPTAKKTTAKKTTAKKTARKKTATKPTARKKTAAKKTAARKSAPKKTPRKKTAAKKTAVKKSSAAKKTSSRKSAPKKTPRKKTAAKKTAVKKSSAAKKTPRKKTTAKKTPRKKPVKKSR